MSQDLNRLAGRALMVDVAGTTLSDTEKTFLRDNHIRAICLFRRNVQDAAQTRTLVQQLRDACGDDVLIGIDQEGGAVMRTLFLPQAPSAMALGAVGDEALAHDVGAALARGLASLGINLNYGPVLDLNNNPQNPVIGERSFGEHPESAVRLAAAWMRGHQQENIACCVKHFPGHGDTHTDSHLDLPVVDKSRAALDDYELAPFRALLPHSASLMSAHILFPQLDEAWPATLSPAILGTLLRQQWGYQGVAITDGMNMKAIRARWGQAAGTAQALRAGADLSLVLQFVDEMAASRQALVDAVHDGSLGTARLAEAEQRVNALVARHPSRTRSYSPAQEAADVALFASAWRRALTAHGQPLRPTSRQLRLVLQQQAPSDGVSEAGLSADTLIGVLRQHFDLDVVTFASRQALDWATLPQDGRYTVLASTTRERYGAREAASWQPDLHLALWNPYAAADLNAPALLTYGFADAALHAVADWLLGTLDATGRMPARLA